MRGALWRTLPFGVVLARFAPGFLPWFWVGLIARFGAMIAAWAVGLRPLGAGLLSSRLLRARLL